MRGWPLVTKIQKYALNRQTEGESTGSNTLDKLVDKIKDLVNTDKLQAKFDVKFTELVERIKKIISDQFSDDYVKLESEIR